jgi:hypothetical protein
MITGIAIENFKGISDRVEIELRPITLLFGPNSAGKSSILHALHYAREVLAHHNLDADSTSAGARFIDLGGFRNLVHGRDPKRKLTLRLAFQFQADDFPVHQHDADAWEELLDLGDAKKLVNRPSSGAVELRIAWSKHRESPYVARCLIQLDDEDFAEITATDDQSPEITLRLMNPDHRILRSTENAETEAACMVGEDSGDYASTFSLTQPQPSILRRSLEDVAWCFEGRDSNNFTFRLVDQADALPMSGATIGFAEYPLSKEFHKKSYAPPPGGPGGPPRRSGRPSRPKAILSLIVARESTAIMGHLVTTVLRSLHTQLDAFRYLGPMREIPPRNSTPPRSHDPNRWSTGLGAWDLLQTGKNVLVRSVSDWLQNPKHLDAGVRLERVAWGPQGKARQASQTLPFEQRLFLVPKGRHLWLTPHDVGVGISQIVPVLVAALDEQACLDAIEEPGYHLHPRLQAEVGDVFVEGIHTPGKQFLIETHSEHLLLRLLRRVREKSNSTLPSEPSGLRPDQLAVFYVEKQDDTTSVTPLHVTGDGDFAGYWPEGFFDERTKELL